MVLVEPSVDMNHSNAGVQSALLYWIRNYYHPKECLEKHSDSIWPNVWEHSGSVNWQHKINQYTVFFLIFTFLFYEYSSFM